MEKNKNKFLGLETLCFVLALQFFACGVYQEKDKGVNPEQKITERTNDQKNQSKKVLDFSCGEFTQRIRVKNIDWVHFNNNLLGCLMSSGFEGKKNSNLQLATIIRSVKMKGFSKLFIKNREFRGPEVFEALLDIGYDQSRTYTTNAEPTNRTRTHSFAGYYISMIKTIGDFDSPGSYMIDKYKWSQERQLELTLEAEVMYEYSDYLYKTIVEAWQEGKIVLKDYGEK